MLSENTAESRRRLVAGAADMMRRRGLNATSVRELAKHAQAPLGSTYHYFPGGKYQLAAEAVQWADDLTARALIKEVFDVSKSVTATLRRINNTRGHLQFRYESRSQADLRNYLGAVYRAGSAKSAILKIEEIEPRVFSFQPVSDGFQRPRLSFDLQASFSQPRGVTSPEGA